MKLRNRPLIICPGCRRQARRHAKGLCYRCWLKTRSYTKSQHRTDDTHDSPHNEKIRSQRVPVYQERAKLGSPLFEDSVNEALQSPDESTGG